VSVATRHRTETAFAPASVGNVGVGFDILGHSIENLGDRVSVTRTDAAAGVVIREIRGVVTKLPLEAKKNTAGRALLAMQEALALDFGFEVEIDKGIPLGSGLGGSAASAVAAVVAANALLEAPASMRELLQFAIQGEAVASGSLHADNVAPSLLGGLVLTVGVERPRTKVIPVPAGLRCVVAHPHMVLATSEARQVLKKTVTLSDLVWQTANLAGFISACYTDDLAMLGEAFVDVVIEPQRQVLIPGFSVVQQAAMSRGALGCSISGAGPSVFAWCKAEHAEAICRAMVAAFAAHNLVADGFISRMNAAGAHLVR
jgi:homoserine kinase